MKKKILQIGLLYDSPDDYRWEEGPTDRFAEFEPESTIQAMKSAILELGHLPVTIGAPKKLIDSQPDCDLIWNIAEGYGTRNREAWAPVLMELRSIPYIGSDAHTLSTSLDKAGSKIISRNLDIPTPQWTIHKLNHSFEPWNGPFPVFIKPRYEGTAKGINQNSVIFDNQTLHKRVVDLSEQYQQDIIIEVFLSGEEYTCALTGTPLRALPVLQRALHKETKIGYHAIKSTNEDSDYIISHHLPPSLEKELQNWSLRISDEMNVKDFVRVDFKTDECDNPYFLEINPLPTFATDNTFAILAEMEGVPYPVYLSKILQSAINRIF